MPAAPHQPLPSGFHVGFALTSPDEIAAMHRQLVAGDVVVSPLEDLRPNQEHVTFRCRDPNGTEIEVFWEPA
jgi:hypothetical protein